MGDMQQRWFGPGVALVLVLAGCAVGSSAEAPGDDVAPNAPRLDAGSGAPHASQPDDEDEAAADGGATAPDGGTATDAGKDAPSGSDAGPTGPCAFTGVLATYDLNAVVGTTDLPAKTTATGVTATALTRTGVTAVSSSQAMNASGWPTGGLDTGKHFALRVAPPAGCRLTLTSVTLDLKASATGPTSAALATSGDGFATRASVAVTTAGGASEVSLTSASNQPGNVDVRVYGFDAGSGAGTLRLQNTLTVKGVISP